MSEDDGTTPFGRLLRRQRTRRNVTQEELAYRSDLSARHVSFLETGRSNPSRGSVLALSRALELPLRDRNALLRAAGFAAVYPARELEAFGPEPAAAPDLPAEDGPPALPVHLRKDGRDLRLLSFLVTVAAPRGAGWRFMKIFPISAHSAAPGRPPGKPGRP